MVRCWEWPQGVVVVVLLLLPLQMHLHLWWRGRGGGCSCGAVGEQHPSRCSTSAPGSSRCEPRYAQPRCCRCCCCC